MIDIHLPRSGREAFVDTRPNEEVTISLEQPGGTGLLWQLATDAAKFRIVEERIVADDTPDSFGGTGSQVFVVEPLVEGVTELVFRLKAPWTDRPEREERLTMRSTRRCDGQ